MTRLAFYIGVFVIANADAAILFAAVSRDSRALNTDLPKRVVSSVSQCAIGCLDTKTCVGFNARLLGQLRVECEPTARRYSDISTGETGWTYYEDHEVPEQIEVSSYAHDAYNMIDSDVMTRWFNGQRRCPCWARFNFPTRTVVTAVDVFPECHDAGQSTSLKFVSSDGDSVEMARVCTTTLRYRDCASVPWETYPLPGWFSLSLEIHGESECVANFVFGLREVRIWSGALNMFGN